jgi:hypothetical protein
MDSVIFAQNAISEISQLPVTELLLRGHHDVPGRGSFSGQHPVLSATSESSYFHLLYCIFTGGIDGCLF